MMIHGICKSVISLALLLQLCLISLPGCIDLETNEMSEPSDNDITTDNGSIYLPPINYDYSATIFHNDIERNFIIHVSQSYEVTKPTPLVFVLHGGGGSAEVMSAFTGFNAIAAKPVVRARP